MADWNTTSKMGFDFEDYCLQEIRNKTNLIVEKNEVEDNLSYYDLMVYTNDGKKTVECKYDEKAGETGNICIEIGCEGKLSGLTLTKANYWIISDGTNIYVIKTSQIRNCIRENNNLRYMKNYPVQQEDGFAKLMNLFLIPINIFTKYCDEVDDINSITYNFFK